MGKYWVLGGFFVLACGGTTTTREGTAGKTSYVEDAGTSAGGSRAATATGGAASHARDMDASAGADARAACATGDEGCHCYGNKTCNGHLTCASNLCVDLGGPDASRSAGGHSSGGSSSAAGASGAGAGGTSGGGTSGGGAGGSTSSGGAGASGASGGSPSSGGAGGNGAGGAHQCYPDQTICNDDPAGCCLGLRCVSATGAPNAVCTPSCTRDSQCSTGCCAPLDDGTGDVCAPPQYCAGACIPADGSCTSAASACCAGTRCVYDDATNSTASCAGVCNHDNDCVSGCCAPLSDGSASVCADPSYCTGTCLPDGTRPCGLGTPCCPGSYCTSDSQNQICLPLCSTNADCVSGCCAVPNGNGVHVCTDPAFCP